jgi:flagellar brake protein
MDTLPMPLDSLAAAHGGLHDFRMTSSVEPWAVDSARAAISLVFDGDPADPRLQSVLQSDQVIAVGVIDDVKVQFEVSGLVLVQGASSSALRCAMPREMYRFQRRDSYRVRPPLRAAPAARLAHPQLPPMLRILDVSMGGCALFLPGKTPSVSAGTVLEDAQLDLEVNVRVTTDLRIQHVSELNAEATGMKLGCQFLNPSPGALRNLQHYIAQTQKRARPVVV